jgi:hypothetical protein
MALSVPVPILRNPGGAGTVVNPEQPIELDCNPVLFPGGAELTLTNARRADYLLQREFGPGTYESWDEEAKRWVPETDEPAPQRLLHKDGRWQAILVAVGQKDATGADKLATVPQTHVPRYSARCFFTGVDSAQTEHEGQSPRSVPVEIPAVSTREQQRASVEIEPKPASAATSVRLFLKDAGLVERGRVEIREEAGGFAIELRAGTTRLTVSSGGEIVLAPTAGQFVRVDGTLAVSTQLRVAGQVVAP